MRGYCALLLGVCVCVTVTLLLELKVFPRCSTVTFCSTDCVHVCVLVLSLLGQKAIPRYITALIVICVYAGSPSCFDGTCVCVCGGGLRPSRTNAHAGRYYFTYLRLCQHIKTMWLLLESHCCWWCWHHLVCLCWGVSVRENNMRSSDRIFLKYELDVFCHFDSKVLQRPQSSLRHKTLNHTVDTCRVRI